MSESKIELSAECVRALLDVDRTDPAGAEACNEAREALAGHDAAQNLLGLPWTLVRGFVKDCGGNILNSSCANERQDILIAAAPKLAECLAAVLNGMDCVCSDERSEQHDQRDHAKQLLADAGWPTQGKAGPA